MTLSIGPVALPSFTEPLGSSAKQDSSNSRNDNEKRESPNAIARSDAASAAGPNAFRHVAAAPRVENQSSEQPNREQPERKALQIEDQLSLSGSGQLDSLTEQSATQEPSVVVEDSGRSERGSADKSTSESSIDFSSKQLGINLGKFQPDAEFASVATGGFQSSLHVPNWLKGVSIDELISLLDSNPSPDQKSYTEKRAELSGDQSALNGRKLDVLA